MSDNNNPYQSPGAEVADINQEYSDLWIFTTEGRLGRLRYLTYSFALSIAMNLIVGVTAALAAALPQDIGFIISMIIMIVTYVMVIVTAVFIMIKRFHDLNRSGWLSLLMLIPLINLIVGLLLLFAPGKPEVNNYGPPPPPNSRGLVIASVLIIGIFVLGIVAAIALPMMMTPEMPPVGP
jgi:uncharacterized membrane protein YhaH (DUF805 family)